ncbi:MAG: LacI family transcriptional regulator [Microbacteriaceae bacterium]|nr:LacI family transcriptional regulator [Microbacteriaceae bacterium]MCL2794149.1 LacI family transcriptional regulator [Microbacteriaceae bacterium]
MAASVKDVALHAGVSVGTVSNVLNNPGKVSQATIDRVRASVEALGFVRNDAARQLRAGRSRSIGMVVLDIGNPFFTDIARGAEGRALRDDLVVLLGASDDDASRESSYLQLFEEQRVAGILISPRGDVEADLLRLQTRGVPVVLVDETASDSFSSVAVDDVAGGRMAVEHLIGLGRRRIAVVGGPESLHQIRDRVAGARAAVAAHPDAALEVIPTAAPTVLEGRGIGELLAARPPSRRPDAVFAVNDLLAVGLLQGLTMLSDIRVPEDVALIGYDDIEFASSAVVPLSSIRQPSRLIGETAVELLLDELAGDRPHRSVLFRPELVVRASTAGAVLSA